MTSLNSGNFAEYDRLRRQLRIAVGALLLALRSTVTEEYDFKPSPETELESGMTMIVMADVEGRKRLEEIVE